MEKNLQRKITTLCNSRGMLCLKVHAEGVVGFPDLFIAGGGRVLLMEVKHPGKTGRLRPSQIRMIAKLQKAEVEVYVVDDYDRAKEIITG